MLSSVDKLVTDELTRCGGGGRGGGGAGAGGGCKLPDVGIPAYGATGGLFESVCEVVEDLEE